MLKIELYGIIRLLSSHETLTSSTALVVLPEDPEVELFRYILDSVIDRRITKELDNKPPDQQEKDLEDFKKRRIRVYLDALQRGYPLVIDHLSHDDLAIQLTEIGAVRTYHQTENGLSWRVTPTSTDRFDMGRFYKELHDLDLPYKGTSFFAHDPFLIDYTITLGQGEQMKQYSEYTQVRNFVKKVRTFSPKTLSYLASPQVYFGYIDEVEHDLARFRNQPNKQADYFIEKYVASHSLLFDRLPKIASIALDVLEIRDRVFGSLTTATRKKIALQPSLHEDTDFNLKNVKSFIIHFLTNPRVSTVLAESGHRTTPERVFAVNEIIYQLRQQHPAEADGTLLSIAYRLFGQHEERFKSTFAQLGLPVDLTWEYVQGIVMDRIKLLPDPFYTASKTELDSLTSVNVIYYVDPKFEAENVERKPASTSSVDDFIELFVHKGIFRKNDFIQLSEPEREKIFTAVFESEKLTTPAARREAIERTLKMLKIQYLLDKKRFGSKYEEQTVRSDEWLLNAQELFVNLWLQQVKKGKAEVLIATDEIVLRQVIGPFLKRQVKKLPQTIRGFDGEVFKLNAKVGTGALSYTDAFSRFVHLTAAYILQMWLSDDNKEDYSLAETKAKVYDLIRQNFTKDRLLPDRTQEHTFHSVTTRKIDNLIRQFQIQYYPRKQIYLESVSEMLGQSLSAICNFNQYMRH